MNWPGASQLGLHATEALWHACIDFPPYRMIIRAGSLVYVRVENGRDPAREDINGPTIHSRSFGMATVIKMLSKQTCLHTAKRKSENNRT